MNKQITNYANRLSTDDMKKMYGGRRFGMGNTSSAKCAQTGPCMTVYVPGWVGCCSPCCLGVDTGCVDQQAADPACAYI